MSHHKDLLAFLGRRFSSPKSSRGVLPVVLALVLLVTLVPSQGGSPPTGPGQTPSPAGGKKAKPQPPHSVEALESRIKAVQEAKGLDEETRKKVVESLGKALESARAAEVASTDLADLRKTLEAAPGEIKSLRAEMESLQKRESDREAASLAASLGPKVLSARLDAEEKALAAGDQVLKTLDGELAGLAEPEKIREEMVGTEKNLAEIERDLKALLKKQVAGDPTQEATLLLLETRQERGRARLALLRVQLEGNATLRQLLQARRDRAALQQAHLQVQVKALKDREVENKKEEVKRARERALEAQQEAARLPIPVQEIATANVDLTRQSEGLIARQGRVNGMLLAAQTRTKELDEVFKRQSQRVKLVGLTPVLSLTFRQERQKLPDFKEYRRKAARRREELGQVAMAQLDLEERRRSLPAREKAALEAITEATAAMPEARREAWRKEALAHVQAYRQNLERLEGLNDNYQRSLAELEIAEAQLVKAGTRYGLFIDRHLLWSRSVHPLNLKAPAEVGRSVLWILAPERWEGVAGDLVLSLETRPLVWGFGLLLVGLLVLLRSRLGRRLSALGERTRSVRTDSFLHTLETLGHTLLLAVGWPLLILLVGWNLQSLIQGKEMTVGLGAGLVGVGFIWLGVSFLRQLLRDNGLGAAHFKWPQEARTKVLVHLRWFLTLAAPSLFVVILTERVGSVSYLSSLGRLAFLVAMVGVAVYAWAVMRPGGVVMKAFARRNPASLLVRSRIFWFPLALGCPLVLAVLAVLGYHYTGLSLAQQALATFFLFLGLLLGHELLLRWLLVTQRRLAYAQALERRDKARREREQRGEVAPEEPEVEVPEPESADLATLSNQTRSLLRVAVVFAFLFGLYAIWARVLPALQVFDEVELWSYAARLDGQEKVVPITLTSLFLAIFLFIITLVSARNLPGLLEMAILSRFEVEPGSRYAWTTLTSYAILAIGVILTFNAVGVGWSHLQFLVAALGVGLGFGLQEIFANFVSGLILLFERPIRVGDAVTVGGVSGIVTRIRIRATTITDWDRKELVVPNKEFVTGQLVNWSLTDPVTRLTVPVGIAYGSDIDLAEEVLTRVAHENSLVLEEPKPKVFFHGFGDNTLNFEVRVFTRSVDNRPRLKHQLHCAIDKAFRAAGITIAFPQRDVHLDTVGPLVVRLEREGRGRGGGAVSEADKR